MPVSHVVSMVDSFFLDWNTHPADVGNFELQCAMQLWFVSERVDCTEMRQGRCTGDKDCRRVEVHGALHLSLYIMISARVKSGARFRGHDRFVRWRDRHGQVDAREKQASVGRME